MTTVLDLPSTIAPAGAATRRGPRPLPLVCKLCHAPHPASASATCEECLGPLEPALRRRPRSARCRDDRCPAPVALALPRMAPLRGRAGRLARHRLHPAARGAGAGAPAGRGARVGQERRRQPSLAQLQGPRGRQSRSTRRSACGLDTVGCASTGNLANAVAAQAARAGLPAWIFIPHDLEPAKVMGTRVYAPRLVRVRGTYDDVNRLCAQVADSFGWGLVNVNLRAYYGEGSKTMAFEIIEQLGWRPPTAIVAPMAGGALVTKLHRGLRDFAMPAWCRARRHDSMACRPTARADRPAGRVGRRADRSRSSPKPSPAPSRSAIRPTDASQRRRSGAPAAGSPA